MSSYIEKLDDFIDRQGIKSAELCLIVDGIEKELETLRANANKCYCAFCSDNIERTWDDLKSHMVICEKHPLFITKIELETTKKLLDEAVSLLSSFNEYREATDRKETSKSNTKWHTYERMLYDFAAIFLNKLKNERGK